MNARLKIIKIRQRQTIINVRKHRTLMMSNTDPITGNELMNSGRATNIYCPTCGTGQVTRCQSQNLVNVVKETGRDYDSANSMTPSSTNGFVQVLIVRRMSTE